MNGFKYKLKQTVVINELKMTGTVRQLLECYSGVQYEVRYFHNGEAKTVWFYEDELT